MNNHVPSDLIPLHDEMIISFVNYELKVSLLQKTKDMNHKYLLGNSHYFSESS